MNNQGLEALAALASAAPASNTANTNKNDSSAPPSDNSNSNNATSTGMNGTSLDASSAANLSAAAHFIAMQQQQQSSNQQQSQFAHSAFPNAPHCMAALNQAQYNNNNNHNNSDSSAGHLNTGPNSASELSMLQQMQRSADPSIAMIMQNIAYYQLLLQSQAHQQSQNNHLPMSIQNLLAMSQAGNGNNVGAPANSQLHNTQTAQQKTESQQQHQSKSNGDTNNTNTNLHQYGKQQVSQHHLQHGQYHYGLNNSNAAPVSSSAATVSSSAVTNQPVKSTMPPPAVSVPSPVVAAPTPTSSSFGTSSRESSTTPSSHARTVIAPQPQPQGSSSSTHSGGNGCARESGDDEGDCDSSHADDKKELKRAANRRSAQLSRKRKKQFIEELKDENDDLRRKEQILKSIPDLVVVFDSTGKLWFVSQSISRFVGFKARDLEGKSFWERLCPESVRQLKAAFMDSLAARGSHTDTVPLGDGLWDLQLVDKDGSFVAVTLNGVVHFAGERPECVCCIRPKENSSSLSSFGSFTSSGEAVRGREKISRAEAAEETSSHKYNMISDTNSVNNHSRKSCGSTTLATAETEESNSSSSNNIVGRKSDPSSLSKNAAGKNRGGNKNSKVPAMRISDSGNSSGESESGSSDEMNATN